MQTLFSKKNIVLATLVIALLAQAGFVQAKKMFRWVDDNGNVFYSDQVPPTEVKHRRESLNKNARVLDVVEKEKTKEQRELANRLRLLKRQQQAIIDKQRAHDKVLLSTFRNVEDMLLALKGQMLSLDGKRKVVRNNLNRLEQQLLQKQKKAAQYEREGRRVPVKLLTDIDAGKQQIENTYVEISTQFQKKKKIRENFERDVRRFTFLVESRQGDSDTEYLASNNKAANELGLFVCETIEQCHRAWVSAKEFVRIHSTVELDIETDTLIMSQTPYTDTDISLSVSKMNEDNGSQQLFLDIRCLKSSLGDKLCRGPEVNNIRFSFNEFIASTLPAKKE